MTPFCMCGFFFFKYNFLNSELKEKPEKKRKKKTLRGTTPSHGSKQNKMGLIQIPNFERESEPVCERERERERERLSSPLLDLAAPARRVNHHHHPHCSALTESVMGVLCLALP